MKKEPEKFKISGDGKYRVYRRKTFIVITTEEEAKEMVLPLLDFTAYMLTVTRVGEMPSAESLKSSKLARQSRISTVLANARGSKVEPQHIYVSSFNTNVFAGCITIDITETIAPTKNVLGTRRLYRITLMDETKGAIIQKIYFVVNKKYPNLSDYEKQIRAMEWFGYT
jgi:hypothetical protein